MASEITGQSEKHDTPMCLENVKDPQIDCGSDGACIGIVHDALVITARGVRPVQNLRVGDPVVTRSNGIITITKIEQQSLVTRAVYVLAGSFGHYASDRDTVMPAGQPLLVRDWRALALAKAREVTLPAEKLIDGQNVRDLGSRAMTVYRLFCGSSQVLYADGMEMVTADADLQVSD